MALCVAVGGTVGNVTVGNVSMVGTKAMGTAELTVSADGGNTGKVVVAV